MRGVGSRPGRDWKGFPRMRCEWVYAPPVEKAVSKFVIPAKPCKTEVVFSQGENPFSGGRGNPPTSSGSATFPEPPYAGDTRFAEPLDVCYPFTAYLGNPSESRRCRDPTPRRDVAKESHESNVGSIPCAPDLGIRASLKCNILEKILELLGFAWLYPAPFNHFRSPAQCGGCTLH